MRTGYYLSPNGLNVIEIISEKNYYYVYNPDFSIILTNFTFDIIFSDWEYLDASEI